MILLEYVMSIDFSICIPRQYILSSRIKKKKAGSIHNPSPSSLLLRPTYETATAGRVQQCRLRSDSYRYFRFHSFSAGEQKKTPLAIDHLVDFFFSFYFVLLKTVQSRLLCFPNSCKTRRDIPWNLIVVTRTAIKSILTGVWNWEHDFAFQNTWTSCKLVSTLNHPTPRSFHNTNVLFFLLFK